MFQNFAFAGDKRKEKEKKKEKEEKGCPVLFSFLGCEQQRP